MVVATLASGYTGSFATVSGLPTDYRVNYTSTSIQLHFGPPATVILCE